MAEIIKKQDSQLISLKPQYVYREPDEGETPDKKPRIDEGSRAVRRYDGHENLCRVLVDVPEDAPMPVCSAIRCRCLHDVAKYLQSKPPDLGPECYIYKLKGHCPRGVTCRFGAKHITEAGRNKTDINIQKQYEDNGQKTCNFYSRETEGELRKRTYNFRLAEEVLNNLPKPPAPAWMVQGDIDFTEDVDVPAEVPVPVPRPDDRLGPCPDDDLFKLHVAEKKKIDWKGKLYLPALSNFGNLPFRRICKEFGADITCSEPLIATNMLEGSLFDWLLARRHESEDMFGVQLYGCNPFILTRAAQLMEDKTNADFLDLRCGNPGEPLRFQTKSGLAPSILTCLARVTTLPLTVCTKFYDFQDVLPTFKSCDISLITVLGRHKDTREVDWTEVDAAAQLLNPIPMTTCSDVFTHSEYYSLRNAHPQLAGLVVSRGAIVKPWLFTELGQKKDWDISSSERFDILQRFVHYGLDHWGSDSKGVEVTRRFLLDWMSLLCRYIPVGLLERPPQKLNDRCVKFVGRDDMETLLGSQDVEDWLKVSEMLLGPTPEGYQYHPKVRPGFWPHDT